MIPKSIDAVPDAAIVERLRCGRPVPDIVFSILNAFPQHRPGLTGEDILKRIATLRHFGVVVSNEAPNTIDEERWADYQEACTPTVQAPDEAQRRKQ